MITRQSKGKILTHAEVDNNFSELEAGIIANTTAINNIPLNPILQDGTVDMDAGYIPTNLLSLVTKEYSDTSVASVITDLNTPSTIDGDFRTRIENPTPAANDMFGEAIAAYGDIFVAGVPSDTDASTVDGAVYLYNIDGTLIKTITSPDEQLSPSFSSFGSTVALSSTRLYIADTQATRNGQVLVGTVWIYDHSGNLLGEIYPADAVSNTGFGGDIVADDNLVVIRGFQTGGPVIPGVGMAYVYDMAGTEIARITPPADTAATSLALTSTSIFIGAQIENSVFEYTRTGTYVKTITATVASATNDRYGIRIAATESKLVIGATGADGIGAAYIYNIDGTNEIKVGVPAEDVANTYAFGRGISIDGDRVLIGSPYSNDIETESGVAYLFDTNGNLLKRMVSNQQYFLSDYGYNVIVTAQYLIISSYGDPGTYSGAVYVYDRGIPNEVYGASTLGGFTADDFIKSDIVQAGAGSIAINNIVKISQVDYDALVTATAVDINTHYIII